MTRKSTTKSLPNLASVSTVEPAPTESVSPAIADKFPSYRLVWGANMDSFLMKRGGAVALEPFSLLVSYEDNYLRSFFRTCPVGSEKRRYIRSWVLDSGAFSVWTKGRTIDLTKYIEDCKQLKAADPMLTEIFALDVIGDWRASLKNYEAMWKAGVEAIPTYHVGEPADVLLGLARDYPKIALGGAVGYAGKLGWAQQCFARVWPKKMHGLGFGSYRQVMSLPWHSVDSSNYSTASRFGKWMSFGPGHQGTHLSVRGHRDMSGELNYYIDLEKEMQQRWADEMKKLECSAQT